MIPAFGSSPAAAAMKVDLPEPDGPRRRRQRCRFSLRGMLATKLREVDSTTAAAISLFPSCEKLERS